MYSYQSLERGQWRTVTTVMEETYTSGCVEDTEWAEHLATETKWCYCDQDLCNGHQDQDEPQHYEYQDNFIEGHGLKVCSLLCVLGFSAKDSKKLCIFGVYCKHGFQYKEKQIANCL